MTAAEFTGSGTAEVWVRRFSTTTCESSTTSTPC